jgi:hypothetical protein
MKIFAEIRKFVKFIVENKIFSLNRNTITFDSNLIKGLTFENCDKILD